MTEETHRRLGAADLGLRPICSFATESFAAPRGDIVALRVVGEIDLASLPALRDRLGASRRGAGSYLVVDLGGVGFCSVCGFGVLAAASDLAAEIGIGYALVDLPPWFERHWSMLPLGPVQRYRGLAQAVMSIRADQVLADPA